ncbi:unnamed protein product [Sphacelaria rigidula]
MEAWPDQWRIYFSGTVVVLLSLVNGLIWLLVGSFAIGVARITFHSPSVSLDPPDVKACSELKCMVGCYTVQTHDICP